MLLRPNILPVTVQPRRGMPTCTQETDYRLALRRVRQKHPFYIQSHSNRALPRILRRQEYLSSGANIKEIFDNLRAELCRHIVTFHEDRAVNVAVIILILFQIAMV